MIAIATAAMIGTTSKTTAMTKDPAATNVMIVKIKIRAMGASQIVGMALVTTTTVNSVLTVRNPASNTAALTIPPLAGGMRPVSAHLVITQLA